MLSVTTTQIDLQVPQKKAVLAVNTHLVENYWTVGEYIVEYEQGENERGEYDKT